MWWCGASRNRSLKEQGTQHIINSVKYALDFTVLWRSVWTRHLHNHPLGGEECTRGGIVELTTIVALDDFDGAVKLCGDIREQNLTKWKRYRFNTQRKSPYKMGVIIKDNKIIFITRYANNWIDPQITMY
jgi:hypothetical protein